MEHRLSLSRHPVDHHLINRDIRRCTQSLRCRTGAPTKPSTAPNTLEKRENAGMSKSHQSTQGHEPMNSAPEHLVGRCSGQRSCGWLGDGARSMCSSCPGVAQAGKLSWLDDLVQEVILEAKAGGKGLVRGGDGARTEIRGAGRLFVTHEADETLEQLVRRSEELARAGRRVEQPTEALLQARFSRLLKQDPQDPPHFRGTRSRPRSGWSSSWARRPRCWRGGIPAKPRPWCAGSAPKA